MKKLLFTSVMLIFLFTYSKAFTEDFTLFSEKQNNENSFYSEKDEFDYKNHKKEYKNYAKIGSETYSQTNIWFKPYIGIDINWYLRRFGSDVNKQISDSNFWIRFQNLDVYGGIRIFKHLGAEIGYIYLGNSIAKDRRKHALNGPYASVLFYSPMIDLKYTTIEPYLSIGSAMLFSGANNGKPDFGGRVGCGFVLQIYGPITANVGLEYYYPFSSYTKKGFLAFKTGISLYLTI